MILLRSRVFGRASALILVLLFQGSAFSAALTDTHSSTTGRSNPAAIYHNYCSVCHGDKGDGNSRAKNSLVPPPRDFTTPEALTVMSRDRMIHAVKEGRSGTAMASWKTQLNDKEIEAVVDYIRNSLMLPAPNSDLAGRGRDIYAKSCSVCHGDKGNATSWAMSNMMPTPRNFTDPRVIAELTRERMLAAVTYGKADTAMAGFASQLSKADIEAVVDYVRNAFMTGGKIAGISGTHAHGGNTSVPSAADKAGAKGKDAVGADMSLPFPNGLKGDAAKGKAFYLTNCATCHGTLGDGKGPRAYFIMPKPRNFLHPASSAELNRPRLFESTAKGRLGTEMPAWNKVLENQEIANVAEFVFQSFIKPGLKK